MQKAQIGVRVPSMEPVLVRSWNVGEMNNSYIRQKKLKVNGIAVDKCYAFRLGSNGWADCYASPLRLNKAKDAKRMPRKRGLVELVDE